MQNLMCDDIEQARLNRERVARGDTNEFYNEQHQIIAHIPLFVPLPKKVITGKLPQVVLHHIYAPFILNPYFSWVHQYRKDGGRLYGLDGPVGTRKGQV